VKIVIDAMTAEFGGIRTYVDQLVGAWETSFPNDEVHVAVPAGSTIAAEARWRHELRVRRPSTLGRPLAQTFALHRLVLAVAPDAVLAAMPSTTLRRSPRPIAVVVHDLRHELRPQQFSLARRVLRRVSYARAYAVADGFISVSARTQGDLHRLQPSTRGRASAVVHHGADHVRTWPAPDRDGPAIAFAHHTNKNPDLIIEAWEVLATRGSVPRLMILGVGGDRERLQGEIDRRGLRDAITLAPYLPEDDFRRTVSSAAMIVFPSDFEGFGLPVVEGMSLGKPVVIGPDKATIEVAGGHAVVMTDWSPTALAEAVEAAGRMADAAVETAQEWGESFTWDRAARQTRELLSELTRASRP
jgi:glycosyltransferase involved in cell wall biosynthesis